MMFKVLTPFQRSSEAIIQEFDSIFFGPMRIEERSRKDHLKYFFDEFVAILRLQINRGINWNTLGSRYLNKFG